MAFIKKGTRLPESTRPEFDHPYEPEEEAIYPGVYRCSCGYEIIHLGGELPASGKFPDDHPDNHQHIWWLLVSLINPYKRIKYLADQGKWE